MYDISQPKFKGPQWLEFEGVEWKIDRYNTRAVVERIVALGRIQDVNGTTGQEATQDEEDEAYCIALAKWVLVDWRGEISADYSETNALIALRNDSDLRDFVGLQSSMTNNHINPEAQKTGKKSEKPSRGTGGTKKKSKKKTTKSKKQLN